MWSLKLLWRSEKDVLTRVLRQIKVELVFPADSAFQCCAAALEIPACSAQKLGLVFPPVCATHKTLRNPRRGRDGAGTVLYA